MALCGQARMNLPDLENPYEVAATWSALAEPTDRAARELVSRYGPSQALRAVIAGELAQKRWGARLAGLNVRRDLEQLTRRGGRLLLPDEPGWPQGLDDLGEASPWCLWVLGELSSEPAVAMVGSRASTSYGEYIATSWAGSMALRDISVISGGALGIDGCAHRGALTADGHTVAVLAGGVDRFYPRSHSALLEAISRSGAVISEAPWGAPPTRWRFLQRNRLIAAISQATLVVEATWRSGALSTANHASELGRPVAALPGPVTSPASAGCHRLMREHQAIAVTDPDELAQLVAAIGTYADAEPDLLSQARMAADDCQDPRARRVMDVLPLHGHLSCAAIASKAGLEEFDTETALLGLAAMGLVTHDGALEPRWRRNAHKLEG